MTEEEKWIIAGLDCQSRQVRALVLAHLRMHPEIDGREYVVRYNRALNDVKEPELFVL